MQNGIKISSEEEFRASGSKEKKLGQIGGVEFNYYSFVDEEAPESFLDPKEFTAKLKLSMISSGIIEQEENSLSQLFAKCNFFDLTSSVNLAIKAINLIKDRGEISKSREDGFHFLRIISEKFASSKIIILLLALEQEYFNDFLPKEEDFFNKLKEIFGAVIVGKNSEGVDNIILNYHEDEPYKNLISRIIECFHTSIKNDKLQDTKPISLLSACLNGKQEKIKNIITLFRNEGDYENILGKVVDLYSVRFCYFEKIGNSDSMRICNYNNEVVKALILNIFESGFDSNIPDNKGLTALHYAAKFGNQKIVEKLTANGADINKKNNNNETPLFLSSLRAEHGMISRFLLISGANFLDENQETKEKLLLIAAEHNLINVVKKLIESGVNIEKTDEDEYTALHYAAENGHRETFEFLINSGANFNAKNGEGDSPIHLAIMFGSKEIVELLIKVGADINEEDEDGKTPLHYATETNNKEIVKALIKAGADINKEDEDGKTPLHYATETNNKEIVKALIKAGADINKEDEDDGLLWHDVPPSPSPKRTRRDKSSDEEDGAGRVVRRRQYQKR